MPFAFPAVFLQSCRPERPRAAVLEEGHLEEHDHGHGRGQSDVSVNIYGRQVSETHSIFKLVQEIIRG